MASSGYRALLDHRDKHHPICDGAFAGGSFMWKPRGLGIDIEKIRDPVLRGSLRIEKTVICLEA